MDVLFDSILTGVAVASVDFLFVYEREVAFVCLGMLTCTVELT